MTLFEQVLHPSSRYCLLHRGKWVTYKTVQQRAAGFGRWLLAQGVQRGQLVGLDAEGGNRAELCMAMLGAWRVGCAVVLVTRDFGWREDLAILVSGRDADESLRTVNVNRDWDRADAEDPHQVTELAEVPRETLALVAPADQPGRWVQLTHRNLEAAMAARKTAGVQLYRTDVYAAAPKLDSVSEVLAELLVLREGGRVGYGTDLRQLRPTFLSSDVAQYLGHWSAAESAAQQGSFLFRWLWQVGTYGVRWLHGHHGVVGSLLRLFTDAFVFRPVRQDLGLQRVRLAVLRTRDGVCPNQLVKSMRLLLGAPRTKLLPAYGLPETSGVGTMVPANRPWDLDHVGPACPGVRVRLAGNQGSGPVLLGGATLMRGYYDERTLADEPAAIEASKRRHKSYRHKASPADDPDYLVRLNGSSPYYKTAAQGYWVSPDGPMGPLGVKNNE